MRTATFRQFFEDATGTLPYPYQERLVGQRTRSGLIRIPTGCGKTAAVVLAWLWRRQIDRENTPRRLIYCLPMRVLVEQTRDVVRKWLDNLSLSNDTRVTVLMGGEESDDWDLHPESDAILIGTQDMLLSRALNRGYGMSRARWPMAFGLLNTDCLWVFDEIQLMGSGLATTAQLEAFRRMLQKGDVAHSENGHGCRCWWMSATMQPDWLKTVDFEPATLGVLQLQPDDLSNKEISHRHDAKKPLSRAKVQLDEFDKIAAQVIDEHTKFKGRTLIIINTVKRARDLFHAIAKHIERLAGRRTKSAKDQRPVCEEPKLVLLHSRFRPEDRASKVKDLLAEPSPNGTICVSTQVVEAGVDVSATTLFTELAPWASLVQRFGRCNRRGDDPNARVFWIDMELPKEEKKANDVARPYPPNALAEARGHLEKCPDVRPSQLPSVKLAFQHTHVIRRKDLTDLFDTTPDLAGNDIDIDRYVRETEESDVRVFWRAWDSPSPPSDRKWRRISHEEICPAPIGEFREFVNARRGQIWRWDFLDGDWIRADNNSVYPGQTYLVHSTAGGYESDFGWNPKSAKKVAPISTRHFELTGFQDESTDDEPFSQIGRWQTIAEHTDHVCAELIAIITNVSLNENEVSVLTHAARWHDWGKAHEVFCKALPDGAPQRDALWAKAAGTWKKYIRPHFRHELASALGVLELSASNIAADLRDVVAYLIAAHHGKVRLSIRSLPGEKRPGHGLRFARGVWQGDKLPSTELGSGTTSPEIVLSLEQMELGYSSEREPSWTERVLRVRNKFGPFRLAYLEALLRAADMRASKNGMQENRS